MPRVADDAWEYDQYFPGRDRLAFQDTSRDDDREILGLPDGYRPTYDRFPGMIFCTYSLAIAPMSHTCTETATDLGRDLTRCRLHASRIAPSRRCNRRNAPDFPFQPRVPALIYQVVAWSAMQFRVATPTNHEFAARAAWVTRCSSLL